MGQEGGQAGSGAASRAAAAGRASKGRWAAGQAGSGAASVAAGGRQEEEEDGQQRRRSAAGQLAAVGPSFCLPLLPPLVPLPQWTVGVGYTAPDYQVALMYNDKQTGEPAGSVPSFPSFLSSDGLVCC